MQGATMGPTLRTVFAIILVGSLATVVLVWESLLSTLDLTAPELLTLAAPVALFLSVSGYCAARG